MNLKGYQGKISKGATIFSDDPQAPQVSLLIEGTVVALVDVKPSSAVIFRGMADQTSENHVDLVGTRVPFHIKSMESNLDSNIDYKLETVEAGKHYRLKVVNKMKRGNYAGYLKLYTDIEQKPDILIRVSGFIEGEVSVKPQTILIGKLSATQPERPGRIMITSNRNEPFEITKLAYDERLLNVTVHPLEKETGFYLDVLPRLEAVPVGTRQQAKLNIETNLAPGQKDEVQIHIFNSADQPAAPKNP